MTRGRRGGQAAASRSVDDCRWRRAAHEGEATSTSVAPRGQGGPRGPAGYLVRTPSIHSLMRDAISLTLAMVFEYCILVGPTAPTAPSASPGTPY